MPIVLWHTRVPLQQGKPCAGLVLTKPLQPQMPQNLQALRYHEAVDRSFADSKKLTEERREGLFADICDDENMMYGVDSLSAENISERMLMR